MSGVNKVILLGRLGRDPELRTTTSGNSVCNFSIATSEAWKDKQTGEKMEKTEWHNVTVWGKLAELCREYLSKGSQAFIEGKLQTTKYTDKENVERYKTEVVAQTVQFIGKPDHDKNY
jgi:single-strand DNA-binding protein